MSMKNGREKKIKKSIESFEKRIVEHKKKIEDYKKSDRQNYALLDYWEKEIEKFKKLKEEGKDKLD